jgi:hypothetical protein
MPKAQHPKPDPIESQRRVAPRLLQEQPQSGDRHDAERQIDEEHPAPIVDVGQIAAERRAQDRPDHHAHPPDRHGRAALLDRIEVEHGRLRQRHQRRPERALQESEHHHLGERFGEPAQHRSDGEAGETGEEQVLAAEARREPADRRGEDRGRNDIRSEHPGDLVERRRKRALHVGQRDVGDGVVERLHQGRDHGADRDDAAVGNGGSLRRCRGEGHGMS